MSPQTILKPNDAIQLRYANIGIPDDRQLISIHALASAADNYDTEKKYLVAMLVHVKAHNNDTSMPSSTSLSTQVKHRGYNSMSKRPKVNKTYKRVFFFLDLLTQGACFVIFERDRSDESRYWRDAHSRSNTRVGDIMLITEPQKIENEIAGHLSIVKTDRAFLPLQRPYAMRTFMPVIPDQDSFLGFNIMHTKIVLKNIISVDTSCTGIFCDRLYPRSKPCGCYQTNQRSYGANHVFKFQVQFNSGVPDSEDIIASCSSLRLTELLFNASLPSNMSRSTYIEPRLEELRDSLHNIANFVNDHGEWTIAGWFRPTFTQEVGTEEQTYSETYGFHICYIYPADADVLQREDFKALQKEPTDFLVYGL
jgi:hypothetical protein